MNEEGPVRQVLRANMEFDRLMAEGWELIGRTHDWAMFTAAVALLGCAFGFIWVWTVSLSLPLTFFGGYAYSRTKARKEANRAATREAFNRYRAVLEDTLTAEDCRRRINGHCPLDEDDLGEDRGPGIDS